MRHKTEPVVSGSSFADMFFKCNVAEIDKLCESSGTVSHLSPSAAKP